MINTILLSKDGNYVGPNGELPKRPDYDKELLTAFCKNQIVSEKGMKGLPPSMRKIVKMQSMHDEEITMAVTIPEIATYSDVLLVNRSLENLENGKKFRLDNFKLLTKQGQLEIYVKA